jgi:ATP-dependent RNA helicase RhlE
VLDEADRMLDMGFIDELKKILALLPAKRQNLMFSATFSDDVRVLAKTIVNNPVEISVNQVNTTATAIEHWLCPVDKKQKNALLEKLIKDNDWQQVLVFCKTKQAADRLVRFLEQQAISAAAIHGDKSQGARTRALREFKNNQIQVLVATDLAARGLDIPQLSQVVNYNLPHVAQDYIHRIGRTGRAGVSGQAVSLVCADEFDELAAVERIIQQLIRRKIMKGFEPAHALPESRLDTRPIKPKKPKKPKKSKMG